MHGTQPYGDSVILAHLKAKFGGEGVHKPAEM